jgi:hypothetical protein
LSFADAIDAEPARLAAGGHTARRQFSYVARGRYAEQLIRWYEHIPRSRILVVRTEELTTRYGDILDFLGLPPVPAPAQRHTRRPENSPDLTPEIRQRLAGSFAEDQRHLAALLA